MLIDMKCLYRDNTSITTTTSTPNNNFIKNFQSSEQLQGDKNQNKSMQFKNITHKSLSDWLISPSWWLLPWKLGLTKSRFMKKDPWNPIRRFCLSEYGFTFFKYCSCYFTLSFVSFGNIKSFYFCI